ncbi:MAG: hypothetical protein FJ096_14950 [Deltaproteobacteria bacterium]|nr:hypothetical protein [Deltaproteobacteria bacterium]
MTLLVASARTLLLVAAFASAPFQCRGAPDPDRAIEDTPAEALHELAERFRAKGDAAAWRVTLEHLRERYPGSRQAVMAASELAAAPGGLAPSGSASAVSSAAPRTSLP